MSNTKLDKDYLKYPHRKYGMDHDRYEWSMLKDRQAITWPDNKKVALWINVALQFFPINQKNIPFAVPGGMRMPYPDLRHYTLRDYGNRVGIYRFFKAFDKYNIKPTFAINSQLAERYPYLLNKIVERGDEITCHGWNMDTLHYGGQDPQEESDIVKRSLESLRNISKQEVLGWLSPARNESSITPELLKANGVEYFSDWVNDELPYEFRTDIGNLWSMPLANEYDDTYILMNNLHSENSYAEQICDACDFLRTEAHEQGGRILALNIHPWMLGQPHRIAKLERVLEYLTSFEDVWSASAGDILDAFKKQ